MNSKTQYRIIAVLICIVIYAIYISLSVAMDWGHGGGYLVLVILVGILRAVWKGVTNLADEEDKTNETPTEQQEETLPEIPVDAEVEQFPVEEEIPMPVEESEESIPQEESEDLPPIPNIEEEGTTIVAPTEEPKTFNYQPKTHWQKFRFYYIIGIVLCVIVATLIPLSIYSYKQKQQELKVQQIQEMIDKATDAYNKSFYDLAIGYLESALAVDSNNLVVNYCIGKTYGEKKEYSKAKEYIEKVYNSNLTKQDLIFGHDTVEFKTLLRGYCWTLIKLSYSDEHEVMRLAQEFISLYPNECKAYRCMIFAFHKSGNNIKAREWARKMVEKFPSENDSYFCLAYILSSMEQYSEAIKNYKKCIDISPSNSTAYNNLGCCYSSIGQYQTAYKYWRKAVEIDNNELAIGNLESHGQNY